MGTPVGPGWTRGKHAALGCPYPGTSWTIYTQTRLTAGLRLGTGRGKEGQSRTRGAYRPASVQVGNALTLLLWPLMRRVLVPSAQLMYQSVPAVVPTTPMSMLSWKTALTTAPSKVSSRSINTELDLGWGGGGQWVERVAAAAAREAWCPGGVSLSSGCSPQGDLGHWRPPPGTVTRTAAHLAREPLHLSSGTAPTAHRRSRLVLLPLSSRAPEHSSTPGR